MPSRLPGTASRRPASARARSPIPSPRNSDNRSRPVPLPLLDASGPVLKLLPRQQFGDVDAFECCRCFGGLVGAAISGSADRAPLVTIYRWLVGPDSLSPFRGPPCPPFPLGKPDSVSTFQVEAIRLRRPSMRRPVRPLQLAARDQPRDPPSDGALTAPQQRRQPGMARPDARPVRVPVKRHEHQHARRVLRRVRMSVAQCRRVTNSAERLGTVKGIGHIHTMPTKDPFLWRLLAARRRKSADKKGRVRWAEGTSPGRPRCSPPASAGGSSAIPSRAPPGEADPARLRDAREELRLSFEQ